MKEDINIMSVQVEKLEHNMAKLTITVPAETFNKAITQAYKKMKNQISIPGFRKGKVPQAMVEKMYGAGMFYEDAAIIVIPEEYDKAMERIRQEAERFRRHDEAVARSSEEFRRSLRVGDILYSSWGWEQTNIDFYQVIAIRGSAVDLRQLDQRTTEDGYMCGTTVPLPDVFKGKTHTHRLSKNYIRIDSYRTAWKWDGQPLRCSWYA